MTIKKYTLDYDWKAEVDVEINDELCTDKQLTEINTFWGGSEDRLSEANGNLLNAVLVLLARTALYVQFEGDYNLHGVVEAFDWDAEFGERGIEGWPKMDGTHGIKITGISGFSFDPSDFTIKES
jgi:hypothetical protein